MANELNSNQIAQILPHRFPFALVDRITDYEPGQWAKGRKCVSVNEQFFCGHFPQEHVMPGVLILEAWPRWRRGHPLPAGEPGQDRPVRRREKPALPSGPGRPATPATLDWEWSAFSQRRGPVGIGECKATVNGELACTAELTFAIGAE